LGRFFRVCFLVEGPASVGRTGAFLVRVALATTMSSPGSSLLAEPCVEIIFHVTGSATSCWLLASGLPVAALRHTDRKTSGCRRRSDQRISGLCRHAKREAHVCRGNRNRCLPTIFVGTPNEIKLMFADNLCRHAERNKANVCGQTCLANINTLRIEADVCRQPLSARQTR